MVFAVACLPSVLVGPPPAYAQDEFSYLLAADTFARGRLANPTHPQWPHLETFHVLQRPTYASKYLPAQGLFLAAGQVVSGFPIVGVWLALGAAAAAVCWMLGGWFSWRWALLGTAVVLLRPQVALGWGDGHWGGGVPLLGGALVLGSLPRLCRQTRVRDAIALGAGLVVLALSRPYEGLVLSLVPMAVLIAARFRRRALDGTGVWRRLVLPAAAVLAAGAAFLAYYNWRVTGRPWRLPYVEYERQYSYVSTFTGVPLGTPPAYRHEIFRRYYREYAEYQFVVTSVGPDRWRYKAALLKLYVFRPFVGWALLVPLLACLTRSRRVVVIAAATLLLSLAGLLAEAWTLPHYFAPALGALVILVTFGLRRLAAVGRWGRPLAAAVVVASFAESASAYRDALTFADSIRGGWAGTRARIERRLADGGGKHLVLVRYGPQHRVHDEWVYNGADIDGAPVVWAREMDDESNRRLLEYFRDRTAWLILPDQSPVQPLPYVGD